MERSTRLLITKRDNKTGERRPPLLAGSLVVYIAFSRFLSSRLIDFTQQFISYTDNVRAHQSHVYHRSNESGLQLLDHPCYSPDLALLQAIMPLYN